MKSRGFAKALIAMCAAIVLGGMTPFEAPVADAAMRGEVETVRALLRDGADVNEAQGDGMTALHWAARHDDVELARILIYAGARVDAGTRIGSYTPLHIASRESNRTVVDVLLEAGSDPAAVSTNSGTTPLHLAARSGSSAIVSRLIEYGADVEVRESAWGQTPLVFAAAMNRVEAIRMLLDAGADPNSAALVVDVVEMAAADKAAEKRLENVLEVFKEQEGGGPGWQPTPSQVQAAIDLARAVQANWPDVPHDEDGEEEEEVGEPAADEEGEGSGEGEEAGVTEEEEQATDEAPESEDPAEADEQQQATDETAEPEEGAEAEADDEGEAAPRPMSYAEQVGEWGGLAPIHHAVRQGHVEATLALLEGGADIDQPTGDNTTPLLMAAINGQWDLASILLENGADPAIASSAGATPLYAVLERQWQPRASYAHPTEHQQQETSHLQMMERLLDAGADPNVRLDKHLWYMEYTFGVLRASGINLKGATPFWRAAYALDVEAMRLLADHGADSDVRTMKPPRRRRPSAGMEEEEEGGQEPEPDTPEGVESESADELDSADAEEGEVPGEIAADEEEVPAPEDGEDAEEDAGEEEGEEEDAEGDAREEEDEEEDKSGLPPVPIDGPAIHPLHAAAGVGYGQSFAGNAHRYVPNGWLPAVKFLVEEMGADVDVRDANGYTALHHAASRGDIQMVLYLVEHGADVSVISRKGETTADMANGPVQRVRPFPEVVALLEQLGSENNHNCVSCE